MNPTLLLLALLLLPQQKSERAVNELLEADRAFSRESAKTDLVAGITKMLSEWVIMPAPGGAFIEGRFNVQDVLAANPANEGARATWAPIRGGISADGLHGFTYGYMTITLADSTLQHAKYMSYWVKERGRWKVRVYKRALRENVVVDTALRPPSLPGGERLRRADHRAGLTAAEALFSEEAQRVGLAAAFAKFGSADAANMGPPTGPFVFGAEAIAQLVGRDGPTDSSPVSWAADHDVIVAGSGDLGITLGVIRQNAGPGRYAFFTIWRRAGPDAPWRYIAE